MSSHWYPISDTFPPLARIPIEVRVHWEGREFIACRVKDQAGRTIWAEILKGRPRPLPVGATPSAWQPQNPDKWQSPLPVPLLSPQSGIMWSEGQSFKSTQLAEDMERDHVRSNRDYPRKEHKDQWWRIGSDIRYEPVGQITFKMCEARLLRALCYERFIKLDHQRTGKTNAAVIADHKGWHEPIEGDATHDYKPHFEPTPRDASDYSEAMRWLDGDQNIDVLRSRTLDPQKTWTEIGNNFHMSREWARLAYVQTIENARSIANGAKTKASDAIVMVQDGNRAHKRERAA